MDHLTQIQFSPMSFRKSKNVTDQWRAFCVKHDRYVSQLPRLSPVLSTADRFDQFLQSGVFSDNDAMLTIMSLTDEEWPPFSLFVDQYSTDWQSYFTGTMYVGYFREHDQRHWQPATTRFIRDDLDRPRLVVHFWAKWDAHDRKMDTNLRPAIEQFNKNVEFRSLDIDVTQLHDVCKDAGVANVPTLAFFSSGNVDQLLVGVRDPNAIIDDIATWLANAKARYQALTSRGAERRSRSVNGRWRGDAKVQTRYAEVQGLWSRSPVDVPRCGPLTAAKRQIVPSTRGTARLLEPSAKRPLVA